MQRYYYLCKSWEGLLQQIVAQTGFGFNYYHIVEYPEKKKDKWLEIDKKLIDKYQMKKSKFQRNRIKSKGLANFYFLRWQNTAVILHSKGQIPNNIQYDDKFQNIDENPLFLKISERITFKIQKNSSKNNKISVFLERNSYKNIKETIYAISTRTKNKNSIINQFNKINGLPSYAGIYQQKQNLKTALIKHCKKHSIKIQYKDITIKRNRNIVQVFDKTIFH